MSFIHLACIFLIAYSVVVTFFCIRFALLILRTQEALESSLDNIDEKYNSISEILERPLFYDSPEVRKVLSDLSQVRDALLEVAVALSSNFEQIEADKEIEDEG